jgi:Eukaryotic DNA topoisomerase I, catalytic core
VRGSAEPAAAGRRDQLLVYRAGRVWHDVTAADINDYLREISGGEYTAKDFRTWHATVLAAVGPAVSGPPPPATVPASVPSPVAGMTCPA